MEINTNGKPPHGALPPLPDQIGRSLELSVIRNQVMLDSPLVPYSVRGSAEQFEKLAEEAVPLLGNVCLSGQSTVWYAPPNAGKTLLALNLTVEAIKLGRIACDNVFYVNADDNTSGLASKLRLLDDAGAHTLVPGYKLFKSANLIDLLEHSATRGQARGVLVIIDTVKKFTSLMDKRESSAFAEVCRKFVMRGGTVLSLAHTAKNPNPDGQLRYAGTTDLLEDMDAAYLITPQTVTADQGERVVEFTVLKRRGESPDSVAYAYAADTGISYDERIASVREVDLATLDQFKRVALQENDQLIIEAVTSAIERGIDKKMDLAEAVVRSANVSKRAAIRVIERYTGSEVGTHLWQFAVKDRGAKVYSLI